MQPVPTSIIYHTADPDGIFSAAIALRSNPGATLHGYNYGEDFPQIVDRCVGHDVIMVDVSPRNWMDMHKLCEVANNVVWIDHHASALRQMEEHKTNTLYANFHLVYESENYGACRKVYQYFNNGRTIPKSVMLTASYDVYRHYGSEYWEREIYPFRFAVDAIKDPLEAMDIIENIPPGLLGAGMAIAAYVDAQNKRLVGGKDTGIATTFKMGKKKFQVLAVNAHVSGDMFKSIPMHGVYDFFMGFFYHGGGWIVSLRGTGGEHDLGAIAREFGGGGHHDAAGFKVASWEELTAIIKL